MNNQRHRREEVRAARASRQEVAELLSRYPRLAPGEVAEILTFLKTGRHLEIGLLTSDADIRPQLDAFMAEHRKALSLGVFETAAAVAGIAALLAGLWLLWELFSPVA